MKLTLVVLVLVKFVLDGPPVMVLVGRVTVADRVRDVVDDDVLVRVRDREGVVVDVLVRDAGLVEGVAVGAGEADDDRDKLGRDRDLDRIVRVPVC